MKIFCCFTQLYRVFFKLFWWIETSQFLFYSFFSIYLNSFIKHTIFSPGFVSFTNVENKGECIFPLYVLTKIFNKFMSKKDFVQVLKFIVLSDLPDPLFRIRPEQNPDLFFLIKKITFKKKNLHIRFSVQILKLRQLIRLDLNLVSCMTKKKKELNLQCLEK